jgi:phosphatidylglycerophosphatase A
MVSPRLMDRLPENNVVAPGLGLLLRPDCAVAFGFGLGLIPWMPGTFGALLAFPLCWLIADWPRMFAVAAVTACVALGVAVSASVGRLLGAEDHGAIVWDETCGAAIALLFVPAEVAWWIAAFVAFRAFDILKPGPIRLIEQRFKGGLGVMMDDVAAGLIAGLLLWGVGFLTGQQ